MTIAATHTPQPRWSKADWPDDPAVIVAQIESVGYTAVENILGVREASIRRWLVRRGITPPRLGHSVRVANGIINRAEKQPGWHAAANERRRQLRMAERMAQRWTPVDADDQYVNSDGTLELHVGSSDTVGGYLRDARLISGFVYKTASQRDIIVWAWKDNDHDNLGGEDDGFLIHDGVRLLLHCQWGTDVGRWLRINRGLAVHAAELFGARLDELAS